MTMPGDTITTASGDGMQAQILLELGRQSTKLAVIDTKLDALASVKEDHETRLRTLESVASQVQGGKDTSARVTSWLAAAAAVGAGIAGYLHH